MDAGLIVTTLGTGVALPHPDRGPTATLLQYRNRSVLVDAGSGALQKLARCGIGPQTLDAVVLTHAHLDHLSDLFPLLFALNLPDQHRAEALHLHASAETLRIIREAMSAFSPWLQRHPERVTWHEHEAGQTTEIIGLRARTFSVRHTASSLGWCFESPEGLRIGIPGDTGPMDTLADHLQRLDLLLIECTLTDDRESTKHLSPRTLRALLEQTRPAHAVITHRSHELLNRDLVVELSAGLSSRLDVAYDGQSFPLPRPASWPDDLPPDPS